MSGSQFEVESIADGDTEVKSERSMSGLRKAGTVGSAAVVTGGSALGFFAAMASPVHAASYTVTQSTDNGVGDTSGTLSWAIAQAEANSGADTITFQPGLTTITFTGSAEQVSITETLSITGPGADLLSIDFDGKCGLRASMQSGNSLTVSGLTLKDARVEEGACSGRGNEMGGALVVYGTSITGSVMISDVTFNNNYSYYYGGGFACDGNFSQVTIQDSTFTNNQTSSSDGAGGGGAYLDCEGDLLISGSTFSGNSSPGEGGGISADVSKDKTITVLNSSFVNNYVSDGPGGGAYFENGTAIVMNSTFSGNTAVRGGALAGDTPITIYQSTLTGNTATSQGGGVYAKQGDFAGNSPNIIMSTISGNVGLYGTELFVEVVNGDTSADASIIGSIVAGPVGGTGSGSYSIMGTGDPSFTISSSLIGPNQSVTLTDSGGNTLGVTDPGLEALADNGGPTLTRALSAGSPALDAGPDPVPTFTGNSYDQRGSGYPRIVGAKADIGAFEGLAGSEPSSGGGITFDYSLPSGELPNTGSPLEPLLAAATALTGTGAASFLARRRGLRRKPTTS